MSEEFETFLGAFQGDSLSGKLFTLVLAAALHHLRAISPRPNPPVSESCLPLEWEYADDCDFVSEDMQELKDLFPLAEQILKEWNLFVNDTKTEYTTFYLANSKAKAADKTKIRGNEAWRENKSLGSLICTRKDIARRITLGWAAFTNLQKVWKMGKKISVDRKVKLYEAQVVSVMLYNCNSWSATQDILYALDVVHRKHLKIILNIKWPKGCINNKALYKRCSVTPLSERVEEMRWKMMGHVLRSEDNTPAMLSLKFVLNSSGKFKGRVGRPNTNLYQICLLMTLNIET